MGLIFRVADPSWFFEGSEGLVSLRARNSVDRVDTNQSALKIRVERKTAPRPVFRVIDQFSFQRIHMHVVKFFDPPLQTPHVEVVESPLPEAW